MKIGLFGGSFNPPHFGHLQIAKIAIKKLRLNQLWWLTTFCNPLKNNSINYKKTLVESKNLTKNYSQIKLKNINYRYSYNLVKKLKNAYPNYDICTISSLLTVKGISDVTLEKSFHFIMNYNHNEGQLRFL